METLILICFAIYFVSICAFFFLGMAIMKAQKNKEISELVRKIAENELDRRDKADSLRLALLDNSNLKHRIFKLLKRYNQMSKTPFGKALREVINDK